MFRDQGTQSFGGLAVSVGNLVRECGTSECVAQIDLAIAQHILIIGYIRIPRNKFRFNRHRLLDDGRRFVEVSRARRIAQAGITLGKKNRVLRVIGIFGDELCLGRDRASRCFLPFLPSPALT